MKKLTLAAIAATALLASCGVNPDDARRVLGAQGVKDPQIGGYAYWGCSKSDDFASKWTGIGADGKPVSGVICGGWLKGYTVRFD